MNEDLAATLERLAQWATSTGDGIEELFATIADATDRRLNTAIANFTASKRSLHKELSDALNSSVEDLEEAGKLAKLSEILAAHYGDDNIEAQLAEVDADFATSANLMQDAIAPLWELGDLLDKYGAFPLTPRIVAREKAATVRKSKKK